jgi:hypothetical protein
MTGKGPIWVIPVGVHLTISTKSILRIDCFYFYVYTILNTRIMKNVLLLTFVLTVLFSYGQTEKPSQKVNALSVERVEKLLTRFNTFAQKTGNQYTGTDIPENVLKSTSAKQKLDSIVSKALDMSSSTLINDWKDEYTYNAKSELTVSWEKEWNKELSVWEVYGKTEIENNTKGLPVSLIYSSIDNPAKQLLPETRTLVYYSNTDKIDSLVFMAKDENQQWIKESKAVYQYNAAGKASKLVIESYGGG